MSVPGISEVQRCQKQAVLVAGTLAADRDDDQGQRWREVSSAE